MGTARRGLQEGQRALLKLGVYGGLGLDTQLFCVKVTGYLMTAPRQN